MRIYYGNIFIGEIASNRSMTVEEALDHIEFDEEAFKQAQGFDEIDYNEFRTGAIEMSEFNLAEHLQDCEIITEEYDDVGGGIYTIRYKALELGRHLRLLLFDSGQASLEYRRNEIETFYWDEESAELIADIDNVKIADLFAMMYSKRWVSSI